eukprot:5067135-Prymnesium_polylepis.1
MSRRKCPFTFVTIEGVPQKVSSSVVNVGRGESALPSGKSGTFTWRSSNCGESREQFEGRITASLGSSPAATAPSGRPPPQKELASLDRSLYSTPTLARAGPARRVSGERSKLSP